MSFIELTVKKAYFKLDKRVINTKSAFIGLCTDIDRFFNSHFGFKMNEKIDEKKLSNVYKIFPKLSGLNCEQFNRILILFSNIRAVNAHLLKNTQIIVDEDLIDYFTSIAEPKYQITQENKLTLYGCFYLLSFLSCKYQIWPFVVLFIRPEVLDKEEKNDFNAIQQKVEKFHQELCGNGKPFFNTNEIDDKKDLQYLNDKCKASLTQIFFSIEKVFIRSKFTTFNSPSFRIMLNNINELNNEDKDKILDLRNAWLHGKLLNDIVADENKTFTFNLDLVINTLDLLKSKIKYNALYGELVSDINDFGQSIFNYYVLRLIEVSYKILDVRLLTSEKLDERIKNSLFAFENFNKVDFSFYKKISPIMDEKIRHKITKEKFSDKMTRRIETDQIKIFYLHSDTGFQIGDFHSDLTDLVLTETDVYPEYQNKINGKYLSEYQFKTKIEVCPHIIYCEE